MDLATTLSLVQTILTAIQTLGLMHSERSIFNCRSELDDLQNTVETVRAVLEDADAKQDSLNSQEKHYVKELKDAVYDADDVLDEFLTLAKQQKLRDDSDKFSDKVKSFFSRFKYLTHNLSSKVKMVNDKLNKIASKSAKFSFKVDCKSVKFTKEETSSFICDKIIGREEDVEKILGVLLGSVSVDHPPVSLLAIVGMGGLGKTALAQLVYKDPRISEAFQLKRWTCIADQDQDQWSLKGFLGKVVKGSSINDNSSLDWIQEVVKQQLGGQKYLLVLDDVWTESYDDWQKFEESLKVGGRGSWIIVTTRSKTTAQMITGDRVHVLQGLSELESWQLFERIAFQAEERDDVLVKLGKEIVKKCTNVPLAIRVVGSLLRGQSKSKWLSFHDKGLEFLRETNDTMTRILKLSYDQLNPSLKACFAYCAIFPKDWEISKQMLLQLWMAQGYINSKNLGEEYFLILLQRCFFQEIHEDEFGGIKSFKIHDLLHDIAEKVAEDDICRFNIDTSNVGKRVRHLSFVSNSRAHHIFNCTHIRTCLQIKDYYMMSSLDQLLVARKLIQKWTCLRSLDLRHSKAETLSESIGQLLHLRSLDLSSSHRLKVLPKSITKLVNLQTLNLHDCKSLKQVPDDVSKLVDLSTLNVGGCDVLRCMPASISMLTCLHTLCQFVVGAQATSTSEQCFNGLKELQHLNKLEGRLKIQISVLKDAKFVKEEHGRGSYLRNKEHLQTIVINFRRGEEYGSKESEQALLEEMQPHCDVKALELEGYHGETIPRWPGRGDNSTLFDLPNLVTLEIRHCSELLYLPWQIATLPHLENLKISDLPNVEYVADADSKTLVSGEESSFFASLQNLVIYKLPKLKGWWWRSESGSLVVNPNDDGSCREANLEWVSSACIPLLKNLTIEHCEKTMSIPLWWRSESGSLVGNPYDSGSSREANIEWVSSPCIPLLKNLTIEHCEKTMFIPLCPRLEFLKICDDFRFLSWSDGIVHWQRPSSSPSPLYSKLKTLKINNLEWLKAMPMEYTQFISKIEIVSDESLESLGEVNDFPTCLCLWSSLLILHIDSCPQLKSVGGWLEHFSALEELRIVRCPKLVLDGVSLHNLADTLRSLELAGIEEMEELPEGMQYCTSLQFLVIEGWPKMKFMPKWMPKLASLQELELWHCSESLIERCQQPNGKDWPLIQHIRHISEFSA